MSVKNFYPEKSIVPYQKTHVEMGMIILHLKELDYPVEVKRSAYIIIRNETANGQAVVNGTNLCGAQSDSGRWPAAYDSKIVAVCVKNENMTGRLRGFLVFDSIATGVAFVCDRVQAKGIFIGEHVDGKYHKGDVTTPEQAADAYADEWVQGQDVTPTKTEVANYVSMYNQACKIFT